MDMDLRYLLFIGSALVFSVLLAICILLIATSNQYPIIKRSKKEKYFINPISEDVIACPSIAESSSLHLSVIIPAYNEESRIPIMLQECTDFLEPRTKDSSYKYEIIVVSDGSQDGTVEAASKYCKLLGTDKFRILNLETNRGKGGAVRLGMQSARGAALLFADADGATQFADLAKLETSLNQILKKDCLKNPRDVEEELAISVGSRAHLQEEAVAKRNFLETY